jgi:hypothetical protein
VASDRSDSSGYISTNVSSNTCTSLETTASLTTSDADVEVAARMEEKEVEERERQQIKEWHNRVFKDIKNDYDCLSKEDIQKFRVKTKDSLGSDLD